MKSKDRQEIFKDERTIQIEHKIGNELAFFSYYSITFIYFCETPLLEIRLASLFT